MALVYSLRLTTIMCALAIISMTASITLAQSGSRTGTSPSPQAVDGGASSGQATGSANRRPELPVGLQGYCPVCLIEMRQWVKGDRRFTVEYDGRRYYFPGAEQAEMFKQDPLKYVPVLGGDDIVHFARTGKRAVGRLTYGVIHKGRTYFFVSAENKQLFKSSPEAYTDVDLALGGECIVCRVAMNQRVPGVPEFSVI